MIAPTLETERLILRDIREEDLDGWAELMGDPDSARYIGGTLNRAQSWRAMATFAGCWSLKGFGMFSVVEKASGRWIGRLGPWQPEGWPGTEVGWGLHPDAQGKGYGVEAAAAALDYAFDVLGWTEVIHCIDPGNTNSQGVARKLGSSILRHALLPPPISESVDVWGQTREQWRARRA